MLELGLLNREIKKCTRCAAVKKCLQPVTGLGDKTAPLMILGNVSTKDDDFMEEPFAGRVGDYIKRKIKDADIDLEDCYFTNAIKCRTPRPKFVEDCKDWFYYEISIIRPKILLALGFIASNLICGVKYDVKIPDEALGKWNRVDVEGINVDFISWYNPKFLLVSGKKLEDKTKHLFEEIRGKLYG